MKGEMNDMNFEMILRNWNMVDDVGLPHDDEYMIAIWGEEENGYTFSEGSYCKDEDMLRTFVFGIGSSLEGKHIKAWLPMYSENIEIRKITHRED